MTRQSEQLRGLWLLYLVLLGSIPFLDGLTYPQSPEGFHPRHNVQLGWKLIHVAPALVGIGLAASLIKCSPMKGLPAIAILAMQIALGVADHRRIGFNSAVPREFAALDYLVVAGVLAVPFAVLSLWILRASRRRRGA